jgi:hypothetical protein
MELKSSKHGRMQSLAFDHVQSFLLPCLELKARPKANFFALGPMEHPSKRNAFSLIFLVLRVGGQKH